MSTGADERFGAQRRQRLSLLGMTALTFVTSLVFGLLVWRAG